MYELQNPTKSDIIHYCISEFSSGIAVINRLLGKEFVEEYPDPKDKRAKRLRITPKGTQKLFSAFSELKTMSEMIFSPLSTSEKELLFQIFDKLHKFHKEKHDNK
jgi:DNA-binding MarR family transcriptional regulator